LACQSSSGTEQQVPAAGTAKPNNLIRMNIKEKISFKDRALLFLLRTIGVPAVRFICRSCRMEVEGMEYVKEMMSRRESYLCALWHQRIFFSMALFRDTGGRPMVSLSRDGEYITTVLKGLGYDPVRGSTSRRSYEAFKELLDETNEGTQLGITPDGPKGPPREVKDGILYLAKYSGRPIVPVSGSASSFWMFNSWDRFIVPKPFSRISIKFSPPIYVNREADEKEIEIKRAELQNFLNSLSDEVDRKTGHTPLPISRIKN